MIHFTRPLAIFSWLFGLPIFGFSLYFYSKGNREEPEVYDRVRDVSQSNLLGVVMLGGTLIGFPLFLYFLEH